MTTFTSTRGAKLPYINPATGNFAWKSYTIADQTSIDIETRYQPLFQCLVVGYIVEMWAKMMQGGLLTDDKTQHVVGNANVTCNSLKDLVRSCLFNVSNTPASAKEWFPGSPIFRIGHYCWTNTDSSGNVIYSDLQFLQFKSMQMSPPDASFNGIYFHLYPGWEADVTLSVDVTDDAQKPQLQDDTLGWFVEMPSRGQIFPI